MKSIKQYTVALGIMLCLLSFTACAGGNTRAEFKKPLPSSEYAMKGRRALIGQPLKMSMRKSGTRRHRTLGSKEARTIDQGEIRPNWVRPIKRYTIDRDEFQEFILDIPKVSFDYKGYQFIVGGSSVDVIAKWDDLEDGIVGRYSRDYLKNGYQLKLNRKYLDSIQRAFWETVRHEAIHYIFDKKYNGRFALLGNKEWSFITEMIARLGTGMNIEQALKDLEDNEDIYHLSNEIRHYKEYWAKHIVLNEQKNASQHNTHRASLHGTRQGARLHK